MLICLPIFFKDLGLLTFWNNLSNVHLSSLFKCHFRTQTPQRREINLSAIADLKLKSHSNGVGETNQFCHTFHRELSIPTINIFHTGDAVIVSTDSALAMSQGVVRYTNFCEIVAYWVDRYYNQLKAKIKTLQPHFWFFFRSITSEEIVLSLDRDLQQWSGGDNRFHVDRYEYQVCTKKVQIFFHKFDFNLSMNLVLTT
jgi:hypothetical protein